MEEIIDKIAAKDESALRELYDVFHVKVYNLAISYLQNIEEAEELTQDVFVEIFKSASRFKKHSSVSTWIYRITVNKSLDLIRFRQRKKRFGEIKRIFSNTDGQSEIDIPDFVHPGVLLENKENATIIFKLINILPDKQKTAFILSHIEELPRKEVADIMNLSLKSIESLLFRARMELRNKLSDHYPNRGKKYK